MKKYLFSCLLLFSGICAQEAAAQAVVFPQQKQAGIAVAQSEGDLFTLKNDLFEASFVREDGTLRFNGSDALYLKPGTELFNIVLDDGTTYYASDMTLVSVETEDLHATPTAARGSDRVDGKAIKAVFTQGDLTATWRAILRDGSHYLRTEIDLTSTTDQAMESLTPMIYTVDVASAGSAPEVVGNTRGAVLLSDKIFAGLETPMGVNSATTEQVDGYESFSPKSWTETSFSWLPGNATPDDIVGMEVPDEGNTTYSALTAAEVCGARGYVTFRKSGEQTITFSYTSGTHRLNIVGVDVVDIETGEVVAHDYHYGWTGTAADQNTYTINVPKAGSYILRYFMETHTETITSAGTITFSENIATPVIVYDAIGGGASRIVVSPKATDGQTVSPGDTFTQYWTQSWWTAANATDVPEGITALGYDASTIYKYEQSVSFSAEKGDLATEFQYTSGNNRLQIVGVDLVDADGTVVAYDYHFGYTGGAKSENTYTFNVPTKGTFTLRYFVTNSGDGEGFGSAGTITTTYTATAETPVGRDIDFDTTLTDTWAESTWTAAAEGSVPEDITSTGYAESTVYTSEQTINVLSDNGDLTTEFQYTGGNNRLQIVGVDLVSGTSVVASDYHFGFTGGAKDQNTYTFNVATAGTYTLRYFVTNSGEGEGFGSTGTITTTYTKGAETPVGRSIDFDQTLTDTWAETTWTAAAEGTVPEDITSMGYAESTVYTSEQTINVLSDNGDLTTEFQYTGGNNRLQIVGVDLVSGTSVVASDYHFGFTGGAKDQNTYTFNVATAGTYTLRYFVTNSGEGEGFGSTGTITTTYTKGAETPVGRSIDFDQTLTDTWAETTWTAAAEGTVPEDITSMGYAESTVYTSEQTLNVLSDNGDLTTEFQYTSGNNRLQIVGVDLVSGTSVVASDYHFGYTGGAKDQNTYTFNVATKGTYTLRYFVTNAGDGEGFGSTGTITTTYTKSEETPDVPEGRSIDLDESFTDTWTEDVWTAATEGSVPEDITSMGYAESTIYTSEQILNVLTEGGVLSTEFQYTGGNNRLQIVGVDLTTADGVAASDYHFGFTGGAKNLNVFSFKVPAEGKYTLRYFVTNAGDGEGLGSTGTITTTYTATTDTIHIAAATESDIQGYWRRKTTLKAGETWNVSSVVGLVADGQARRSFLAYSERERAVPWRAMPVYISWYELNIDRNNAAPPTYSGNMTEAQCLDVLQHWNDDFYSKYNKAPKAFVWDDGWDEYGTWKFNPNFPEGFKNMDTKAQAMGSGIGAWLGPVGGYGTSGDYRRSYWSSKGGMQLSNDDYYQYFINACTDMVDDYEFRFFKFDGISAQSSAVGPDNSDTGYNNAEAIINIERAVRKQRPDIFYNTTVGTWASPFWFHFTDAVWRQEGDYGETGQGTDREQWITYRDRLVYQNFVQNSPICPINTLMTHGFILSTHGQVSTNFDYAGVVRELRCAFACGSGMVELYNDYSLMNSITDANGNKGALWNDLSECMDWQERNSSVLPDIHWVGGNPWTGTKAEVYGWAAWNGEQCVLTLRNGSNNDQTFTTTLREALDIPSFVNTNITLKSSFDDQTPLEGLALESAIDIDEQLSITVPAHSVFVAEGTDNKPTDFTPFDPNATGITEMISVPSTDDKIYDLTGRRLSAPQKGINIIGHRKVVVR